MQRGLATSKLSVRLSVERDDCDKTKESFAHISIPYKRPLVLFFREEKWLVG